jgi:hypothetical protein
MRFATRVFLFAGLYGLVVLVPMYFLEGLIGRTDPPAITHPEYFYGFLGAAVAWQLAFLVIASDPQRYRPVMLAAILEKFGYGIAVVALLVQKRIAPGPAAGGMIDLVLGVLFVAAYIRLGRERALE